MLHHENGSDILRKCPPVVGGSVIAPGLREMVARIPGCP